MSGETRLSPDQTAAYLRRLDLSAPPSPDPAGLRQLHRAHLRKVPFENLDIHLGTRLSLELDHLVDKLVARRRGGFCYELNGTFAALLRTLGFQVSLLEARVYDGDEVGIRFDHLCLQVDLDQPYLADVGFGSCFGLPLGLTPGVEQRDPNGTFAVVERDDDRLDLVQDGTPVYHFSPTPRALEDFAGGCAHHQSSPDSPFTRNTVCSLELPDGRVTLRGLRLIETRDHERSERDLDPSELPATYAARFDIQLDEAAIRRLVAGDGARRSG